MALDSRHTQEIALEIYDRQMPNSVEGVTQRDIVTHLTEKQRDDYGRYHAARLNREVYGVRLVRITVETLKSY